jgi:hypothetical protein
MYLSIHGVGQSATTRIYCGPIGAAPTAEPYSPFSESLSDSEEFLIARKVSDFRLPVEALRAKARNNPPPQSWFDEEFDLN